jgi:hypothetical protein
LPETSGGNNALHHADQNSEQSKPIHSSESDSFSHQLEMGLIGALLMPDE